MLLRPVRSILLLSFLIHAASTASAISPDLRLIALVPLESQVIAGMLSPSSQGQPSSLLLFTRDNRIDLQDFFAVTGADTSRQIREVVFVAAVGHSGRLSEHSLLVSGHFDRGAILRSADRGRATTVSYRGLNILAVPAFARERSIFNEVRWLAILDSNVAVFGSAVSIRQEIDRYLGKSVPDPLIMERLSRLGREDDAWCLLPSPGPGAIIPRVLEKLDPKLGVVARQGGSMQYGIHFGRRVEITASANPVAQSDGNGPNGQSAGPSAAASYLLPRAKTSGDDGKEHIVVKVPLRRYMEWLDEYSKGSLMNGGALSQ